MKKYVNKFWIIITLVLCVLFIVLFLPLSIKSIGVAKAMSYTVTGVAFIWIIYFVRAYIFSGFKDSPKDEEKMGDGNIDP